MISRKEFELELQNLTAEGLHIFGQQEVSESLRPSLTTFGEVPRSELSPPIQSTSGSFLPKTGEEIISLTGHLHPLIRPLFSKMPPSESGLPIVEEPSMARITDSAPEAFSVEAGVKAPLPSPIETRAVVQVKDEQLLSPDDEKRILFIHPPNIHNEAVIACYRYAVDSGIIRPKNPVTIIWSNKIVDESVEPQVQEEFTPSEGLAWKEHIFKVSASNFNEAVHELREISPSIHQLIECTDILSRKFYVKLQAHGGLKWMIQQELQQGPKGGEYDLVVMPCFGKKESNKDLEQFVITHSPIPVVLVRLQEYSSAVVPNL